MEQKTKNVASNKVDETTKRGASPAQTIKSFGQNVKKIEELKLLNSEDTKKLKELHEKAVKQYLGYELY